MSEENKIIEINSCMYFDAECGRYGLTSEASHEIYREKELICSYSGASEWLHHFTCEMLDFCSGASIYNYAIGTIKHEEAFPKIFSENKEAVIRFVERTLEEPWGKKMYELIEAIIKESVSQR